MGKPLPTNLFIDTPPKRCGFMRIRYLLLSGLITIVCSFITTTIQAQVIVETFEEMDAGGVTSAITSGRNSRTVSVGATSSTINITGTTETTSSSTSSKTSSTKNAILTSLCTSSIDSYTTLSTCSKTATSTTLGPDSTGTFTWFYGASGNAARMTISSNPTSGTGFHSNAYYLVMPTSSVLITPIVPQGISVVTFWVRASTAGNIIQVGVRTTATSQTSTTSSTHAGLPTSTSVSTTTALANNTATYPTMSTGATTVFSDISSIATNGVRFTTSTHSAQSITKSSSTSIVTSSTTISSASGSANWSVFQVVYTVPSSLQSAPGQVMITATGATINIDDIEVFSSDIAPPGTWTGNVGTDWNNPLNWAYNQVPTPSTNVIIPNVANTNFPVLSTSAEINNLTINTTATVSINGFDLVIDGAISGLGKFIGSATSDLEFGSASSGTIYFTTSPGLIDSLTLDDGANITLGSSLEIVSTGILTVGNTTGATLNTNGRLNLWSDNNGSARVDVIPVDGTGAALSTITGSVNVLCYVHSTNSGVSAARRGWRLLTAPITNYGLGNNPCTIYSSWQAGGVNISGQGTLITAPASVATGGTGNGMDAGINANYSMYKWDITNQKLTAVSNTKTGISNTNGADTADNIGYFIFIRGDRTPGTVNFPWLATINNTTLTSTGPLQLGDQLFTSVTGAVSATANGLSLIGNPFASSIDFSQVAGDDGTGSANASSGLNNILNRIYVWNSNLTGSQGVGEYVCIDDANYDGNYSKNLDAITGTSLGNATAADLSIQSGQAFFVQTNLTAPASVTIKEATKSTTNNYIYRPAIGGTSTNSKITIPSFSGTLSLLNSDSTTSLTDGILAQFKNGYCDCVDNIDAPKFSNIDEMFSLSRDGKRVCIERRSDITKADTLFLTLQNMVQRSYRFNFATTLADHPGIGAHIEDSYTGLKTVLNMNSTKTLDFTIDSSAASRVSNRFMVVFGAVNISPVYTYITAHKEGNTIPVQWSVSNDTSMTEYALQRSTDGINYTTIYTTTAQHNGNGYSWIDTDPSAGTNYYRVLSTDILNEQSYSQVVTVGITSLSPSGITVYPNPIQNDRIGLAMNNSAAGTYHYVLLNDLGQQIQTGSFIHAGGNATTSITINHPLSKGTYRLNIIQPDNTTTAINVLN